MDRPKKERKLKTNGADQVELEKLILKHNLIDLYRYKDGSSTSCTFGRSMGDKISRIDRIYISEYLTDLLQAEDIIKHTASDHDICYISLRTPDNLIISKSNWRLNKRVLKQNKYQKIVKNIMATHLEKLPQ